jgi:hypothetical protein
MSGPARFGAEFSLTIIPSSSPEWRSTIQTLPTLLEDEVPGGVSLPIMYLCSTLGITPNLLSVCLSVCLSVVR